MSKSGLGRSVVIRREFILLLSVVVLLAMAGFLADGPAWP
jgi:hypothetical protein